jgi:hypothetical protein
VPDFDGDPDHAPIWAGKCVDVVNDIKPAATICMTSSPRYCSGALSRHLSPDSAHKKDLQMQVFLEAAEGIRTLDLLHGKQNVPCRFRTNIPANGRFLGTGCPGTFPGVHREFTGVWVVNG